MQFRFRFPLRGSAESAGVIGSGGMAKVCRGDDSKRELASEPLGGVNITDHQRLILSAPMIFIADSLSEGQATLAAAHAGLAWHLKFQPTVPKGELGKGKGVRNRFGQISFSVLGTFSSPGDSLVLLKGTNTNQRAA
jgi:hypothetical protein